MGGDREIDQDRDTHTDREELRDGALSAFVFVFFGCLFVCSCVCPSLSLLLLSPGPSRSLEGKRENRGGGVRRK
jgi:hypothetical protein